MTANKSKLAELPKNYPQLFKAETFYFECGDGWFELLDRLLHRIKWGLGRYQEVVEIRERILSRGEIPLPWIAEYFQKNPVDPLKDFKIVQIKEKFGGLRFYYDCDVDSEETQQVKGAVGLAESLSFAICEGCGNPGSSKTVKGSYWIQTLCEKHHAEKEQAIAAAKEEKSDQDVNV